MIYCSQVIRTCLIQCPNDEIWLRCSAYSFLSCNEIYFRQKFKLILNRKRLWPWVVLDFCISVLVDFCKLFLVDFCILFRVDFCISVLVDFCISVLVTQTVIRRHPAHHKWEAPDRLQNEMSSCASSKFLFKQFSTSFPRQSNCDIWVDVGQMVILMLIFRLMLGRW